MGCSLKPSKLDLFSKEFNKKSTISEHFLFLWFGQAQKYPPSFKMRVGGGDENPKQGSSMKRKVPEESMSPFETKHLFSTQRKHGKQHESIQHQQHQLAPKNSLHRNELKKQWRK